MYTPAVYWTKEKDKHCQMTGKATGLRRRLKERGRGGKTMDVSKGRGNRLALYASVVSSSKGRGKHCKMAAKASHLK